MLIKKETTYKLRRFGQDLKKWMTYFLSFSFLRKQKIKKVAVFHIGRCGSTMLADLFSQNSEIHWDGKKISRWIADNKKNSMSSVVFKAYIKGRLRGRTEKYYCLEIEEENMLHLQFTLSELFFLLKELDFESVITVERNYLHSIASRVSAIHSGQWHIRENEHRSAIRFKINLDQPLDKYPDKTLSDLLEQYGQFYHQIRSLSSEKQMNSLVINYESDIIPNPLQAYNRICEFLRIENQKVRVRFVKTTENSAIEHVQNIEELRNYLSLTPFGSKLD